MAKTQNRVLAWVLSLALALTLLPVNALAEGETELEHSKECGYQCDHVCDEEVCGYVEAVEGSDCTHVHDEDCGYEEGVEGSCTHTHDGTCGYVAAVEGVSCNHDCAAEGCVWGCAEGCPIAQANAVIKMIADLPEVEGLTDMDDDAFSEAAAAIGEASNAYDALTTDQQALVTNSDKLKALLGSLTPETNTIDEPGTEETLYVAQIAKGEKTTKYETLDEAITAAQDGDTIELLADATTEGMNLSKDITIKGANGPENKPVITFEDKGIALWGKALTFRDCDVVMNGIGSTPYTAEWGWMTISASQNASLTLDNVNMTMDATGVSNSPHAIYFSSNNKLNIKNKSNLTIKNYAQDALEWNGGDGGYNVNITNSTFVSDHNRSGFTGTFYATIDNSTVDVINSTGNGSNGSHFVIKNSEVDFSNNGSHGLSAGNLTIEDSTVTAINNGYCGIIVGNKFEASGNTEITVTGNAKKEDVGYAGFRLYGNYDHTIGEDCVVKINDNFNTGLYVRKGSLTVADGAQLQITGNTVTNTLMDGYGGGVYVGYSTYDDVGNIVLPADAEIYNNHSLNGGDDIYVAPGNGAVPTISFGAVGDDWSLDGGPDCEDKITGWFDDSEGNRWEAHSTPLHVEEFIVGSAAAHGTLVLKAAHGVIPLDPDDPELPDYAISKSKTATQLDENFQSNVTLALPAADYKGDLDVVFVLDGSTSADESDLADAAAGLLDTLAAYENLNVKAGVVIFGGSVPILYNSELKAISNADFLSTLKTNLTDKAYDKKPGRSGSNLQAGVVEAQNLLDADSTVASEDKYMIILSDGGARMWYQNGQAISNGYWSKYDEDLGKNVAWWNSNEDFIQRYDRENLTCPSFSDTWQAGQTDLNFDKYAMTEEMATSENYAQYAATSNDVVSEGYYSTYEVAVYHAAEAIVAAAESTHVLLIDYPYYKGSTYSYDEYIEDFKSWLGDTGCVTRYDSSNSSASEIFANVQDDLIQVVDAGSYVVDEIGYVADDYNFNFVNDLDHLTLSVGGKELAKSAIEISDATAAYQFGTESDPDQFVLEYYANGTKIGKNTYGECFIWRINCAVTKDQPVQLTYTVKLVNPKTAAGTYGEFDADGSEGYEDLYTNNSATLYPVDSNGDDGIPENFPKPTVSYTVDEISDVAALSISKAVTGNETTQEFTFRVKLTQADGTTPLTGTYYYTGSTEGQKSITLDPNGEATVSLRHGQTISINRIPVGTYYVVTEESVPGYTPSYTGSDANAVYSNRNEGQIVPGSGGVVAYTNVYNAPVTTNTVTVYYRELFTGNEVYRTYTYIGEHDKPYDVTAQNQIPIDGYTYVRTEGAPLTGTLDSDKVIIVYYTSNDAAPDLDVTKELTEVNGRTYTGGRVDTGDDLTYTITVTNTGETVLENIDVTDTLPSGLRLVSDDTDWTIDSLAPHASRTFTITATVRTSAEGELLNNRVTAQCGDLTVMDNERVRVDEDYTPPRPTDPDPDQPSRPDPDRPGDGDDTTDIVDEEVPLAELPGLNKEDHFAYIIGYEDGTVRPEGYITRAEVATIFFRLMTDEYRETYWATSNLFTDVAQGNWYNNGVSTTANVGWISGYPDSTYRPNNNITRAEFATIASRFLSGDYTGGNMFNDIDGHWAADYINRAASIGWITGYPDGSFHPDAYITRAEAVTLINRMLDRAPDADHMLENMIRWPDNPETAWYYEAIQEATNSHDYDRETIIDFETWTVLLENRDWAALEELWAQAADAPGGEVADNLTPDVPADNN